MNGEFLNVTEDNLLKLKAIFPNVFSEEKLDWEKLNLKRYRQNLTV